MVAGLFANTNLDDGKNTRQNMLTQIENSHHDTIISIYNGKTDEELDYEEDPLFAAIGRVPTTDTTEEVETDQ